MARVFSPAEALDTPPPRRDSGLTELYSLRSYEIKPVSEAFLEIISFEVAGLKVCCGAFFSRVEGAVFGWHCNRIYCGYVLFVSVRFASVLIE